VTVFISDDTGDRALVRRRRHRPWTNRKRKPATRNHRPDVVGEVEEPAEDDGNEQPGAQLSPIPMHAPIPAADGRLVRQRRRSPAFVAANAVNEPKGDVRQLVAAEVAPSPPMARTRRKSVVVLQNMQVSPDFKDFSVK
jgi:hypothetical protein